MVKIFVLGDFNMDLVVFLAHLPKTGETLNAIDYFEGSGGKGSNQAIAVARLGADVTFFSAIGNDHYGEKAVAAWQANGVNYQHVLRDDAFQTAKALINVDAEGNNTITVHQGANLEITPDHVAALSEVIAESAIVMCTLGVPVGAVQRAFEIAKAHDVTTLLNPAPAMALSPELITLADFITPNETELALVADGATGDDMVTVARQLMQRDDQTVLVTLGANGAQWVTQSDTGIIATYDVDVVDTVGAGDAFNAGFAVAISEGKSRDDAIQFATAVAALSVTKVGAVDGMPHRADVEAFLSS